MASGSTERDYAAPAFADSRRWRQPRRQLLPISRWNRPGRPSGRWFQRIACLRTLDHEARLAPRRWRGPWRVSPGLIWIELAALPDRLLQDSTGNRQRFLVKSSVAHCFRCLGSRRTLRSICGPNERAQRPGQDRSGISAMRPSPAPRYAGRPHRGTLRRWRLVSKISSARIGATDAICAASVASSFASLPSSLVRAGACTTSTRRWTLPESHRRWMAAPPRTQYVPVPPFYVSSAVAG